MNIKNIAKKVLLMIQLMLYIVIGTIQALASSPAPVPPPETQESILGHVKVPETIEKINTASGGDIGVIFFLSRVLRFATIGIGMFVMWNFVVAGFVYITSAGSSESITKSRDKLTWSVLGIIIIISAYTMAGIIGLVFFKDATFIINPQLEGALN